MKVLQIVFISIIGLLYSSNSNSNTIIDPIETNNNSKNGTKTIEIKEYPYLISNEKIELFVNFIIDENGKIIVKQIDGNQNLGYYLKEKIEKIELKKGSHLINNHYLYKFILAPTAL